MDQFLLVDIVILALGALALIRGGSFTTRHDVLKVGDVKTTADEERPIPSWIGMAGVIASAGRIFAGSCRQTRYPPWSTGSQFPGCMRG